MPPSAHFQAGCCCCCSLSSRLLLLLLLTLKPAAAAAARPTVVCCWPPKRQPTSPPAYAPRRETTETRHDSAQSAAVGSTRSKELCGFHMSCRAVCAGGERGDRKEGGRSTTTFTSRAARDRNGEAAAPCAHWHNRMAGRVAVVRETRNMVAVAVLVCVCVLGVGFAVIAGLGLYTVEPNDCEMSYMWPGYVSPASRSRSYSRRLLACQLLLYGVIKPALHRPSPLLPDTIQSTCPPLWRRPQHRPTGCCATWISGTRGKVSPASRCYLCQEMQGIMRRSVVCVWLDCS